jgi:hypothetical protein
MTADYSKSKKLTISNAQLEDVKSTNSNFYEHQTRNDLFLNKQFEDIRIIQLRFFICTSVLYCIFTHDPHCI